MFLRCVQLPGIIILELIWCVCFMSCLSICFVCIVRILNYIYFCYILTAYICIVVWPIHNALGCYSSFSNGKMSACLTLLSPQSIGIYNSYNIVRMSLYSGYTSEMDSGCMQVEWYSCSRAELA